MRAEYLFRLDDGTIGRFDDWTIGRTDDWMDGWIGCLDGWIECPWSFSKRIHSDGPLLFFSFFNSNIFRTQKKRKKKTLSSPRGFRRRYCCGSYCHSFLPFTHFFVFPGVIRPLRAKEKKEKEKTFRRHAALMAIIAITIFGVHFFFRAWFPCFSKWIIRFLLIPSPWMDGWMDG